MGRSSEEVVRFAVGGPGEPRSLVWRVWKPKGKSDLYISGRTQVGVWKVSLHKSGVWRFAFTKEYWETHGEEDADRLIERWDRPQPLYGGITPAFEIVVPSAELALPRQPLPGDRKKHLKNVTWFGPAPEGFAKQFLVSYTEPGQPVTDTDVEILASFALPDGRTVVITVMEHAISEEQQKQIEDYQRAMAEGFSQAAPEVQNAFGAALEPRGYLYGYNDHGTRFFIDIAGDPIIDAT